MTKRFEVYDINTGETVAANLGLAKATEIARDMNAGKLDRLYDVRRAGTR